ncbi:MAG: response regulator [Gammaproteobacteria bacterium]
MRILLVEDDPSLGQALKKGLQQVGYTIDWVQDGLAAVRALKSETFELMILDLGLPKLSGEKVLKEIREIGMNIPVLILTAKETLEDRIQGLDSGADDYMIKPFDFEELCARLRALQRRHLQRTDSALTYEDLLLDPVKHTVTYKEEVLIIPRREFALLQKLLENVGHVLSREQLTQSLYGWDEDVDSNALEVHIHNLRKKLGSDIIRTIRGIGYMIGKPR